MLDKYLQKLMVCGSSLLMISSLGLGGLSASAKRVHHHRYHYRTHRVMKRTHLRRHRARRRIRKRTMRKRTNPYTYKNLMSIINKISDQSEISSNLNKRLCNESKRVFHKVLPKLNKRQAHKVDNSFGDSMSMYDLYCLGTVNKKDYQNFENKYDGSSIPKDKEISYTGGLSKYVHQDNAFDDQVRSRLIYDINNERVRHGERPVKITTPLQRVADYRAPKVSYAYNYNPNGDPQTFYEADQSDDWIHGLKDHTDAPEWLMKHGYSGVSDPNANDTNKGQIYNWDGSRAIGNTNTPNGLADTSIDVYMNHDGVAGNGHRHNILNANWKYLGVGVHSMNINGSTNVSDNEQFSK